MKRNRVHRALVLALAALAVPAIAQERVLVEAEAIGEESPHKQLFFVESGVIPEGRNEGTVLEANAGLLFVRMGPREQDLLRLEAVGDEPVKFQENDRLILARRTDSASMARANEPSTRSGSTTTATTSSGSGSTTSASSSRASSSSTGSSAASGSTSSSYRAPATTPSSPTQTPTTASSSYRASTDTSAERTDRLPATASWLPLVVLAGVGALLLAVGIVAWRRLS